MHVVDLLVPSLPSIYAIFPDLMLSPPPPNPVVVANLNRRPGRVVLSDGTCVMRDPVSYTYLCPVCSKPFAQGEDLRRHYNIHTGYRPYVCPRCKKGFLQPAHLSDHLKRHLVTDELEKNAATGNVWRCRLCNICYNTLHDLDGHTTRFHHVVEVKKTVKKKTKKRRKMRW